MPVIGGSLVAIPAILQLPRDVQRYVQYRRARGESAVGDPVANMPRGPIAEQTGVPELELIGGGATPGPGSESAAAIFNVAVSGPAATQTAVAVRPEVAAAAGVPVIEVNSWGRNGQFTRELYAFGWLVALMFACYLFGFTWGIPAFCLVYGLTCTRRFLSAFASRVVFAVGSASLMWIVTYEALKFAHVVYNSPIAL
jgi:hypothetical protein